MSYNCVKDEPKGKLIVAFLKSKGRWYHDTGDWDAMVSLEVEDHLRGLDIVVRVRTEYPSGDDTYQVDQLEMMAWLYEKINGEGV